MGKDETVYKKNILDEQGKYSAKYALTNLMFCAECGAAYRRTTWTAKGYKEIVWRCVSRLESGKKKCKHSPTLHEESLHRAIVSAINGFCDVRGKVKAVLKESVQRTIAPEGRTLAQLEKLKKEMNDEILLIFLLLMLRYIQCPIIELICF